MSNLETNTSIDTLQEKIPEFEVSHEIVKHLKERFPEEVDNTISLTSQELTELKGLINTGNKESIEKFIKRELIEDNMSIDNLETSNETVDTEQFKENFKEMILAKLDKYGNSLTDTQKDTIGVAILSKVLSTGVIKGGLSLATGILSGTINNLLNGDIKQAKYMGNQAKERLKNISSIIDESIKPVTSLLDSKKGENETYNFDSINGFLSNPIEISSYRGGEIANSQASAEELENFVDNVQEKLEKQTDKIKDINKIIDGGIIVISKLPEQIQKVGLNIMQMIFKIPLFGGLLAGLLGYKDAKEAIEGLGEKLEFQKSVNTLIGLGGKIDNKGNIMNNTDDNNISLLSDKNLEGISYKELTPFLKTCKKEGINTNEENFWQGVMEGKSKNEKVKNINNLLNKDTENKIREGDFDDDKKPKESFFHKLNNIEKLLEEQKDKKDEAEFDKARKDSEAQVMAENAEYQEWLKSEQVASNEGSDTTTSNQENTDTSGNITS